MKRIIIRNNSSPKLVKPRVFDALVDKDSIKLEIKINKQVEVIDITDVLTQIINLINSY